MNDSSAYSAPTSFQLHRRDYGYFLKNLNEVAKMPEFLLVLKNFLIKYSSQQNSNGREGIIWRFYMSIKDHHVSSVFNLVQNDSSIDSKNLNNLVDVSLPEENSSFEKIFMTNLLAHAPQYKRFGELKDYLESNWRNIQFSSE